uniref:Putative ovule protein n=1 Tax=Solanum chacoense TaxID=4108 RepID=A0A0V0GV97_SOLCH
MEMSQSSHNLLKNKRHWFFSLMLSSKQAPEKLKTGKEKHFQITRCAIIQQIKDELVTSKY